MSILSVVIITYNEEKKIRDCLEHLRWADEIVVVDDCSEDRTVEICKEYTDKVYIHKHGGDNWDLNKNFGMEKVAGDWILLVDVDDRITSELRDEILRVIALPKNDYAAYFIPYRQYYFGVELPPKGAGSIIRPVLVRKSRTIYRGNHLHEPPEIMGKVGRLKATGLHYPYETISQYVDKTNMYTYYEAKYLFREGEKVSWKGIFITPLRQFIYKFFKCRSFTSGTGGLILCILNMFYFFLSWAKLWEMHNRKCKV